MKPTNKFNSADIVMKTTSEPEDWKYSLSGPINNITVNGNSVVYAEQLTALESQLAEKDKRIAELGRELAELKQTYDKVDLCNVNLNDTLNTLERKIQELNTALAVSDARLKKAIEQRESAIKSWHDKDPFHFAAGRDWDGELAAIKPETIKDQK